MFQSTKIAQPGEKVFNAEFFVIFLLLFHPFLIYSKTPYHNLSGKSGYTNTDTIKKKTRIFFSFDARNSFIASKNVRIGGAKIGIEFRDKYRFGIGIYAMDPPILAPVYFKKGTPQEEFFIYRIEFSYVGLLAEYVLFSNRKWEFSVPLIFGAGETRLYRAKDREAKEWEPRDTMKVNLIEASITGHYKIVYWIGVGGGIGYRSAYTELSQLKEHFDAPIFIIKVKLFIGDIYRRWRGRK